MSEGVKVCAPVRAAQSTGPAFSLGDWNMMPIDALCRTIENFRATPQTTVEAVICAVRERGLAALKEASNLERLARCDQAARQQINERITRLIERKGPSR
jgi:hypothetical protein